MKDGWEIAIWEEGIVFQVGGRACAKIWRLVGQNKASEGKDESGGWKTRQG